MTACAYSRINHSVPLSDPADAHAVTWSPDVRVSGAPAACCGLQFRPLMRVDLIWIAPARSQRVTDHCSSSTNALPCDSRPSWTSTSIASSHASASVVTSPRARKSRTFRKCRFICRVRRTICPASFRQMYVNDPPLTLRGKSRYSTRLAPQPAGHQAEQKDRADMALEVGIVGLPNVGKSTIFNALTAAGALAANYPFATIEPNVGVVAVPDERLAVINQFIETEKIIPAAVRVVDIAGIVRGASTGEGLGNKFLSHIREVDAILHFV